VKAVLPINPRKSAYDQVPALIETEISSKEFRRNWARLIQKIYPVRFPLQSKGASGIIILAR
jgi:hypothetical protein